MTRTLTRAYEDRDALAARIERGKQRVAAMPDWNTVAGMFIDILHSVRNGRRPTAGPAAR